MNAYINDILSGNVVILENAQERVLLDISHVSDAQAVLHLEVTAQGMQNVIEHLSKLTEKNTGQWYNYAMALAFIGRYERALEVLQTIRDDVLSENDCFRILYLFYNIGTIARISGDYQTAFRYYMDYLTLDRFYRNERSGIAYKDLLLTINFSAKGKELLDIVENDSRFEYSSFDTLLMRISYYEKLEKYQYVQELLPKAKKYLLFEQDEKKKVYYYFMLVYLHTTSGIDISDTIEDALVTLENAAVSDLPLYYRIKILVRLFLYYVKINNVRKQVSILNVFKKLPAVPENQIPFITTLAHFYYVTHDYTKAAQCYKRVIALSDETDERLMGLSTRMLYYNMLRTLNDFSFLEAFDPDLSFDVYLKYNMRSDYSRTTVNFAVLLGELGEFAKAIGYLRKVVSIATVNNLERFRCIAAFNEAYYAFLAQPNEKDCKRMFVEAEKSQKSVSHYHTYMMILSVATASYLYDYEDLCKKSLEIVTNIRKKFDYSHDPLHEEILVAICNGTFKDDEFYDKVIADSQGLTFAIIYKATGDAQWIDKWNQRLHEMIEKVPEKYRKGYASALLEFSFMNRIKPVIL